MPTELREVMEKYISGSCTMTLGKCQGGDAILEEINKESKSWLKMAGEPAKDQWLHVFRNLDELEKVRKYLLHKITFLFFKKYIQPFLCMK